MESSSWPENLPSDRKRAVEELVRGREFANKLKVVLNDYNSCPNNGEGHGVPLDDLVAKILSSFTNTLSILTRVDSDSEVSQFPPTTFLGSLCSDGGRKSEDSGDSCKSTSRVKDRRGCYKRRKAAHSWVRESSDLIDDGHAWRKYGQKVILNAKFPRNYFRCTHKYDQGCHATKQVQRIEEDPPKYKTTYYGNHTCKNLLKNSYHLILESPDDANDSSKFLCFNSNSNSNVTSKQEDTHYFTSFSSSIKQEYQQVELPNDNDNIMNNQSSSSDHYLFSPDDLSSFDHADVISGMNSSSCTTSTHSFPMDMMVNPVDPAPFDIEDDHYIDFE